MGCFRDPESRSRWDSIWDKEKTPIPKLTLNSDHRFMLNRQKMWENKCELYKQYFRNQPSTDEERNYPLAYIFIVNEHLEAVEELLQIFV